MASSSRRRNSHTVERFRGYGRCCGHDSRFRIFVTPVDPTDSSVSTKSCCSREERGRENDLIFDVGMDIGEDTQYYLAKGFRVVAVEANPTVCAEVDKRNAAAISQGRLTIVNRAISESGQPLIFYVCKSNSAWSTASPRLRDHWRSREGAVFSEIRVEGATIAEIIDQYGVPYYAKVDIEGFDLVCLRGFARYRTRPLYVSVEVDFYEVNEMIRCATDLGYKRFALVGQKTVPKQTQPRPPLEGLAVDYGFTLASSGLFGRELPTVWENAQHLRRKCNAIIRQHRAYRLLQPCAGIFPKRSVEAFKSKYLPLIDDWYDVHASLQ